MTATRRWLGLRMGIALMGIALMGIALMGIALAVSPTPAIASVDPAPAVEVVTGLVVRATGGTGYVFSGRGFAPESSIRVAVGGQATTITRSTAAGTFRVTLELDVKRATVITAAGRDERGLARVVTAVAAPTAIVEPEPVSPGAAEDIPTRVYTNLLAGLAVVLLAVMCIVSVQALRRRPTPTR